MITMIEGPRNTGKTYLLEQSGKKVYKFPYAKWYDILDLGLDKLAANAFGMGRLILHDLDNNGYLGNIITDRSIISPLAWGVIEGRVTRQKSQELLMQMLENGIINVDNNIIYVTGENESSRDRNDHWDSSDYEIEDEMYYHIMETLEYYGMNVIRFENKFDKLSTVAFKKVLEKCTQTQVKQ
tara:strand:- start:22 stop:570 length:549 start_codon:yes stop_codon:yes gene_type:complete